MLMTFETYTTVCLISLGAASTCACENEVSWVTQDTTKQPWTALYPGIDVDSIDGGGGDGGGGGGGGG